MSPHGTAELHLRSTQALAANSSSDDSAPEEPLEIIDEKESQCAHEPPVGPPGTALHAPSSRTIVVVFEETGGIHERHTAERRADRPWRDRSLLCGNRTSELWRALKRASPDGLFDFVEQPFTLSNGRPRGRDITIEDRQGARWVTVKDRPRGVSTFDEPGVPPGRGWDYFRIPACTVLPDGLAIVQDELNNKFGATHYTIAPAHDMPLQLFRHLLEQLAKNAIKEAI